jgi:hypothetical protein
MSSRANIPQEAGREPASQAPSAGLASWRLVTPTRELGLKAAACPMKPNSVSQAAGAAIIDRKPAAGRPGPTATPAGSHVIRDRPARAISSAPRRKRLAMVLGHVSDPSAHLVRYGLSAPADLAGVGLEHAEDDAHGGGLAGAVGPDEPEQLALGDGERQVVEGHQVAIAASVPSVPARRCSHSFWQDAEIPAAR